MLYKTLHSTMQIFVKSGTEDLIVKKHGTDFVEARGNYATLNNRGKLPCMWWADNPYRVIVGADIENTPAPFCTPCRVIGGPIVRPAPQITSRGVCSFFPDDNNYPKYGDGYSEACWGPNPNPNGYGEVTWELPLPQPAGKIEFAYLELTDHHGAQARLHASKPGERVTILVNGQQVSHFILSRASGFHEFLHEDGQQPLDSTRGRPIEVTNFIDKSTTSLRVTVHVGAYSKWDISDVQLQLKLKYGELSQLSNLLVGAVLGAVSDRILGRVLGF